jgi:hypothetical protein
MRIGAAAVVAALALSLGACSEDDPEPKFSPPESSSPAPTETTSEPPAPAPEKLSPEETVRAWVEARNITVEDGNTDDVYALSTGNCKTCRDSVEPVARVYRHGGHYETEGWRVEDAERRPDFARSRAVAVAVEFAAGRTFRTADSKPISYAAERQLFLFELQREQGVWKVAKILFVS